jgi:hypothetical protein
VTGRVADERLIRLGGVALLVAVRVLGMVTPSRDGLTPTYLLSFSGLLVGLALVDLTIPDEAASVRRRLAWFAAEIALAYLVVAVHGTLIRPALIDLLPASRALLLICEGTPRVQRVSGFGKSVLASPNSCGLQSIASERHGWPGLTFTP